MTSQSNRRSLGRRPVVAAGTAVAAAVALAVVSCSASGPLADAVGTAPQRTIAPVPGSWDDVEPDAGYSAVLIAAESDPTAEVLIGAAAEWAASRGLRLEVLGIPDDGGLDAALAEAAEVRPDVVIGAGIDVVEEFAQATAEHPDQQYLVLGAQLPDPTGNLTAVVWDGADSDGRDGGEPSTAAVTPIRAEDAAAAGIAAVIDGNTGVVVSID
ncbi:hypothetical protein [Agromyces seonyuensis]|uniref:BMP family ABC transporter substrate-binding protein n=1 Tax=Agromyces seonyuensis TaxID=2662446 RepID=A0A6I4P3M1_9MICO|nr:hypothetical protein [Agromyces seonyuensis]MWB97937.1 hypothetical protein [Agromyces seonyuensis]